MNPGFTTPPSADQIAQSSHQDPLRRSARARHSAAVAGSASSVGTIWYQALGPGGALVALVEARAQGLARFIGVTGHGWTIPAMHRRSLARFDFDSVLMPYNVFFAQNERYRQAFDEVLAICRERNVAVQIIKSIARGPWATTDRTHATWYQPLEAQADIDLAVHWAMGVSGVHLNSAGDLSLLPRFLDAASRYERRPPDEAVAALAEARRMTSLFGLPT